MCKRMLIVVIYKFTKIFAQTHKHIYHKTQPGNNSFAKAIFTIKQQDYAFNRFDKILFQF